VNEIYHCDVLIHAYMSEHLLPAPAMRQVFGKFIFQQECGVSLIAPSARNASFLTLIFDARLRCVRLYNDGFVAYLLLSVPVKEFLNGPIFREDMDKSMVSPSFD